MPEPDLLQIFAPLEYVIMWKTEYYGECGGEKHVRDIHGMLELSEAEIDRAVPEKEPARRNLISAFQKMTEQ